MRKRSILLLSIGIFVLSFTLFLFIPTLFKGQVSALLQKKINQNIRGSVLFSSAEVNLWRHFPHVTLTLHDFILAGEREFSGDTLIRTRQLHLVMGTMKLFFDDEIEIRELNFDNPAFHIIRLHNGNSNYNIFTSIDSLTARDTLDTHQIRMELESCSIIHGKFLFEDKTSGLYFRCDDITIVGDADVIGNAYDMNIEAELAAFTMMQDGKTYLRNKNISFDLEGSYNDVNNSFHFRDNSININHLELGMEGSYAYQSDRHHIDMNFHSENADFRDLLSLSDEMFHDNFKGVNVDGHLNIGGYVKGVCHPEKNIFPGFRLDCQVNDGLIKFDGMPSSLNEIHLDLVAENKDSLLENTSVHVKKFNMNLGRNPLKGFLEIEKFRDGKINSDIIARIKLEDLREIYPVAGITMNGDLQFDLKAKGPFSGSLTDLINRSSLESKKIPAFDLTLQIQDGNLKYDHLPEAISDLHFHLKSHNPTGIFHHTSLSIDKFEAKLGDNPIRGFVHVKGLKDPLISSEVQATLDLSEIKNFVPSDSLNLTGIFTIDMKVNGQASDSLKKFPLVDTRITVENASLKSPKYPYPVENTHLLVEAVNETGNLKDTRIHIDTLTYTIEDESFFIEGTITDLEKYTYDLAMQGVLHLNKLSKIFHLEEYYQMSGEIDLDLKASGNYQDLMDKKYHRLPTTGHMVFKDVSLKTEDFPQALKIDDGQMFFSNEKIFIDTLHGSIGSSDFRVTGHLYNYLAYVLHSDEDIKGDLLLASSSVNFNELLASDLATRDTVEHELTAFEIPKNLDFTFDANIDSLIYKDIGGSDFKGQLILKNGVLTLGETSWLALGAAFELDGDYDTRNMSHPNFDFHIKIEELDINKAHDAFVTIQAIAPAAGDTYGVFSLDYQVKGELYHNLHPVYETLGGGGTVRIREARVNGMKVFHHISGMTKKEELMNPELKDIVMETIVEDGMMYVKPFTMKLGGFDTDIEGKHSVDGTMSYILKMAIPPFDLLKIPLHISGTYDNPKIHLGRGHEDAFKKITAAEY